MATKGGEERHGGTVSVSEAAALFDRTPRWLQILAAAGFVAKAERGRYSLASVCRGVLGYYEDQLAKASKGAAASRATIARTKEIELRIAERQRHLIPLDDAKAEISALVSEVRAEIAGMGARITRDMELRRQIDSEADGILHRLAQRAEKAGHALATEGGSVEAEPAA